MGTMKTCHEMLVEIKAATELGEIALAKRLDISQPTVNRILNKQVDCKGTTLIKIMRLHEEVCGQNGNGVKRAAASDDTQPPVGGTSGDEKMSRMVA
jgi:predicted transcriptional regulator